MMTGEKTDFCVCKMGYWCETDLDVNIHCINGQLDTAVTYVLLCDY
jgi:hypothetical protein